MDDRLSPAPGGLSSEAAAALGAQLPAAFELSAPVIDFTAAPFSEVTYAYPRRPAARVALDGLPEPMRHELLWWLCSLHAGGERMNSWTLQQWVRVAAALAADPKRPVDSFACLSVEEWIAGRQARLLRAPGQAAGADVRADPSSDDRAVVRRAGARL